MGSCSSGQKLRSITGRNSTYKLACDDLIQLLTSVTGLEQQLLQCGSYVDAMSLLTTLPVTLQQPWYICTVHGRMLLHQRLACSALIPSGRDRCFTILSCNMDLSTRGYAKYPL